jgi:FkbM family methyltransferase
MIKALNESLSLTLRAWRYRRRLDPIEIRYMQRVLRPGDTAVDVGSHKGGWLHWMAKAVGPEGRVFAFEPQPGLAKSLADVVRFRRLKNVTVEKMAVSSSSGTAILHHPTGRTSTGATLEEGVFTENDARTQTAVTTIDDYFFKDPSKQGLRVRFIKVDVETHEYKVLRGAERVLTEHKPHLIFECEARTFKAGEMTELFNYLSGLGFDGHFFYKNAIHPLSRFTVKEHQDTSTPGMPNSPLYANNFVFVPRGASTEALWVGRKRS